MSVSESSPPASLPVWPSLLLGLAAFAIDRLHKSVQIDAFGWRGGEAVPVTPFFDYVLVWNTGISYGLFSSLPAWGLIVVAVAAITLLGLWWWRAETGLTRLALALALGGAISNGVDRVLYGAVADFFHFHAGSWSFYIFNLADAFISLGVLLLILDLVRPSVVKSA